jgi:hypothetical protein
MCPIENTDVYSVQDKTFCSYRVYFGATSSIGDLADDLQFDVRHLETDDVQQKIDKQSLTMCQS